LVERITTIEKRCNDDPPRNKQGDNLRSPNKEILETMKHSTQLALSLLGLAALPFLAGCGSSTEQVKETSTATYATTAPAAQPVVVSPPTTITTTEEKRESNSVDAGNNGTQDSSTAYHSATTTVTPKTVAPATPQQSQTTTYQSKTYEGHN
jgi:hypothetical protein